MYKYFKNIRVFMTFYSQTTWIYLKGMSLCFSGFGQNTARNSLLVKIYVSQLEVRINENNNEC